MREYMHCENLGVAHRAPVTTAQRTKPLHWCLASGAGRPFWMAAVGTVTTIVSFTTSARSEFQYRVAATGSVTYTDNINNAPDEVPEDSDLASKQSGLLFALGPSASVSWLEPRWNVTLSYSRPFAYATNQTVDSTSSDALVGAGTYEVSQTDNVGLSAAVTRSTMTALLFNGQNPGAVTGLNNAGTQEVFRAQVSEFWNREWSEVISSQQSSSFGTQLDLDDTGLPNTRVFSNALALRLAHSYGTFSLGVSETSSELVTDAETSWAHFVMATLGWSRPLTPLMTLALQAGASKALTQAPPQFIGSAALSYVRDVASWSLSVSRTQSADLQTGLVFANESALVSVAATPFETAPISISGGAGVSRFTGGVVSAYTTQAFAAMTYAHEYFAGSLNYVFSRQMSEGSNEAPIPDITRNAITLTLGGVFPPN